eukprot:1196433-Prorocentrum_minimum.AAC.2
MESHVPRRVSGLPSPRFEAHRAKMIPVWTHGAGRLDSITSSRTYITKQMPSFCYINKIRE